MRNENGRSNIAAIAFNEMPSTQKSVYEIMNLPSGGTKIEKRKVNTHAHNGTIIINYIHTSALSK